MYPVQLNFYFIALINHNYKNLIHCHNTLQVHLTRWEKDALKLVNEVKCHYVECIVQYYCGMDLAQCILYVPVYKIMNLVSST